MGLKAVSSRKRNRVQRQAVPELFDEIVWEILIRLPVASLGRFRSVSKAWHAIISDPIFVRAHLHLSKQKQQQDPTSFRITPQDSIAKPFSTNVRFYRWNLRQGSSSTASLLYRRHFPAGEFGPVSELAHCDGLVLLPTNTKTYVFNPAMKDAIALPESRRNRMAHGMCLPVGLGFDPFTGRYKVARSFYRCSDPTGILAMGMEVFTIGAGDGSWRETSADPSYPVFSSQTGKHYEGHLFYFMSKNNQHQPPPGLLRFSLQDETFGVTLFPPNMDPTLQAHDIHVNELDGELSVSYLSEHSKKLVI
ncbi:putative F-box/kelch-repeat protein [Panicum miliaceum]|uniref:F-box/kelch-repeat protein n=1 Tax=Panicum miliaceum TaxID=4540 RepID=A0A3L6SXA0_PANMI|nr:putative F-box/kelch-repeat protein [Panicum miliaceum]